MKTQHSYGRTAKFYKKFVNLIFFICEPRYARAISPAGRLEPCRASRGQTARRAVHLFSPLPLPAAHPATPRRAARRWPWTRANAGVATRCSAVLYFRHSRPRHNTIYARDGPLRQELVFVSLRQTRMVGHARDETLLTSFLLIGSNILEECSEIGRTELG